VQKDQKIVGRLLEKKQLTHGLPEELLNSGTSGSASKASESSHGRKRSWATKPCQNQLTPIKSSLLIPAAKSKNQAFCGFFLPFINLLLLGAVYRWCLLGAGCFGKNPTTATNKFLLRNKESVLAPTGKCLPNAVDLANCNSG